MTIRGRCNCSLDKDFCNVAGWQPGNEGPSLRGNTGTGLLKEGGLVRSQGRADWKYKQAKAFMKSQLR